MWNRVVLVLVLFGVMPLTAGAGTYSQSATTISLFCDVGKHCRSVSVRSPDGTRIVRREFKWDPKSHANLPYLGVETATDSWVPHIPFWLDVDALWSPDSQFIAFSGNPNGTTNGVRVFRVSDSRLSEIDVAREPFEDMLRTFPPCKARYADRKFCSTVNSVDDFNFAAVAWADPRTVVLMGEVPCSSLWGGIMCEVMGYEVDVQSGEIVQRMTAVEFKKRWQHVLAWRFHVPDPPEWQK